MRLSWRDRQFRELKKIIFLAPRKCPIALFGPVANRTILKQLHVAFGLLASVYMPLAVKCSVFDFLTA